MKKIIKRISEKDLYFKITLILFITYVAMITANSWLGDDAFISFRTVQNFVNGYGLTWNTFERVQAFTNSLQVLLLSGLYFITKEIVFTSIIFNVVVSVVAVYILLFKICKNYKVSIMLITLILFSKSFIAFSTSGLETSMTYLLLVLFYYVFYKYKTYTPKVLFLLGFIASLLLLNRMDSILLVLPALFYAFYINKDENTTRIKTTFIGFLSVLPFIIWELFSLIYYGFLFPNTMYSKINLDFSRLDFISKGIDYIIANFILDFVTLIIPLIVIAILFLPKLKSQTKCLSLGVLLSILYIIYIGGDFMLARFLTPAFLVGLITLSQLNYRNTKQNMKKYSLIVVILLSLYSLTHAYNINRNLFEPARVNKGVYQILDEQAYYFNFTSPITGATEKTIEKSNPFWRDEPDNNVKIKLSTGFIGYYEGPKVKIIDAFALSDPLLSRMPTFLPKLDRVGHNKRLIPKGYFETLKTGKNVIKDKNIRKYYDKIIIITQDPIWTKERFKTIMKFNLGKYDYLLEDLKRKDIKKQCEGSEIYQ